MKINYKDSKEIIEFYYDHLGLTDEFEMDNIYLEKAFNEIKKIWLENFDKIEQVKYLLIAEAPLWGQQKKYVYNLRTNNTQFFYKSDLEKTLNIQITDKKEFIKTCNSIGLLFIDISPFPLNTKDTKINYGENKDGSRKLSKKEYRELVSRTMPIFFEKKISLVRQKKSTDISVFFRYARVKNSFQDLISNVLIENELIEKQEDIGEISQSGGGVDRKKLKKLINKE